MKFYYLLNYTKIGEFRFCSHLELKAVWERSLRKAGVPVAFSQGFNPQIKLSFPWALPVNVVSYDEYLKLELVEWISERNFAAKLQPRLPKEVGIKKVTEIQKNRIIPDCFVYRIELRRDYAENSLKTKCYELLAHDTLPIRREKKGKAKTIDAREFIEGISAISSSQLQMQLKFTQKGSVKVIEVLNLLGLLDECRLITKLISKITLS